MHSGVTYPLAYRYKDPEVKWIVFKSTRGCHNSCGYNVTCIRNPHTGFLSATRTHIFHSWEKRTGDVARKYYHLEKGKKKNTGGLREWFSGVSRIDDDEARNIISTHPQGGKKCYALPIFIRIKGFFFLFLFQRSPKKSRLKNPARHHRIDVRSATDWIKMSSC